MSAHPAVEVRDLRKEFIRRDGRRNGRVRRRRVAALHDVSFTLARGECVAILGQNGSGKSTLVRVLSTLLLFEGGSAHVFGIDVSARPRAVQRLVNRVSVEASFFKRMSPAENLSYSARFYGLTPRQTRTAIPAILQQVGFPPERRGEPMEDLSRGMQQKIALARALLTSPELLILDEPGASLDLGAREALVRDLGALAAAPAPRAVILVTHHMEVIPAGFSHALIMSGGRVVKAGPIDEVLTGPVVTEAFGLPIAVERSNGRFRAWFETEPSG